jgi:hypothetical protein
MVYKSLFSAGGIEQGERLRGKIRHRKKVTFRAIFCVLFHFYTSLGSKDTNMQALLSENASYLYIQYYFHNKQQLYSVNNINFYM